MAGEYVIPSPIDPHVHLREPGGEHKEDLLTGTRAAVAGGYVWVGAMPNTNPTLATVDTLVRFSQRTPGRIWCDVGVHYGAIRENNTESYVSVAGNVFGLKVYMNHTTGGLLMDDPDTLDRTWAAWPRGAGPILVHGEGGTLEKALALSQKHDQRLHVCHVSLEEEVDMIRDAKNAGRAVTAEVTPHHLFMTERDRDRYGSLAVMRPPLGKQSDQDALWKAIHDGTIDMVATDHAPHTFDEKGHGANMNVNGIPGLETAVPLMLTAVHQEKLTLDKMVALMHTNPARIFRVPIDETSKTTVRIGVPRRIDSTEHETKATWAPYDGWVVNGEVRSVQLRGQTIYDGRAFVGSPSGRFVVPRSK